MALFSKNDAHSPKLGDESVTPTVLEHRAAIQTLLDHSPNRRKILRTLGIAGAAAGAYAFSRGKAEAQAYFSDIDILNFALNLEYLEAEFYAVATTGSNISTAGMTTSGLGVFGPTTGGSRVAFTGNLQAIANELALDEKTHVTLLQTTITALGGTPVAKPAINLNALGIGFGSQNDFLVVARALEDIGVTAYGGAAPLIKSSTVLGYAARILATEAYHAGNIRLQIAQQNIATKALDGADHLPPPSGTQYFPTDANAITEVRTPGQVLYLAYGAANASSGGFFPNGVNGLFTMSAAAAATSDSGTSTGTGGGTGTGGSSATITASPNPAVHPAYGYPVVTVTWSAPGATAVEVHIGSPTGQLLAAGGPTGSAATGPYVQNGLTFYLQDVSGGKGLTSANTLATVTVVVQ